MRMIGSMSQLTLVVCLALVAETRESRDAAAGHVNRDIDGGDCFGVPNDRAATERLERIPDSRLDPGLRRWSRR
jgi:hypothetical protein